jgi:hypothetical protein
MMKSIKTITISLLVLLCSLTATVADAAPGHYYHGGHYYGGGHYGPHYGVGLGVGIGLGLALDPLLYPYGYYPYGYGYYPYAAPVVVTQAAPTVYVEQSNPAPQQSYAPSTQSSDWYYCRNPAGYYPYVQSCAGGWQRVPAQPPKQP